MMLEIVVTTEYLILRHAWRLRSDSVEGDISQKKRSFFPPPTESKGQPISEIFWLLVEMLKSLKENCGCVIPSLKLPSSSFSVRMVSLSWHCTEDLEIEMSQPKEFMISVLKFGWNSMQLYILTGDYLNSAPSGHS